MVGLNPKQFTLAGPPSTLALFVPLNDSDRSVNCFFSEVFPSGVTYGNSFRTSVQFSVLGKRSVAAVGTPPYTVGLKFVPIWPELLQIIKRGVRLGYA